MSARIDGAIRERPRIRLATLPTPLEAGPPLPGGARLLVKRDDLTGLGLGGNKARKLEFLCGEAIAMNADVLLTAGAAQSNHARMTAAAGAVLGLETHLVLGGASDPPAEGNQLLSRLFAAKLHYPETDDWGELWQALRQLRERLEGEGRRPYAIPLGGSTAVGALGFVAAWRELITQCAALGARPAAVVHATSTGGTHSGLLAGRVAYGREAGLSPEIMAVGVAKEAGLNLAERARSLADECLGLLGQPASRIEVEVEAGWLGGGYGEPSEAGDAAVRWAASSRALVLDRTYTGKALACLLAAAEGGLFGPEDTVVFWHTGGHPAAFTAAARALVDSGQPIGAPA